MRDAARRGLWQKKLMVGEVPLWIFVAFLAAVAPFAARAIVTASQNAARRRTERMVRNAPPRGEG
jgi:hypothetical protein